MLDIKDAVAVITGGAGGIGAELAKYWVGQGGKVVLSDISAQELKSGGERGEIKAIGGQVATLAGDITKEEDCSKLADLAIEKFGRINLVAPCAGIIRDGLMVATDRETGKVAKKMSLANFQAVIDINLTGSSSRSGSARRG